MQACFKTSSYVLNRLLTLLDKGTMKLLIENCRIREFQPGLVEQFMEILDQCQSKVSFWNKKMIILRLKYLTVEVRFHWVWNHAKLDAESIQYFQALAQWKPSF